MGGEAQEGGLGGEEGAREGRRRGKTGAGGTMGAGGMETRAGVAALYCSILVLLSRGGRGTGILSNSEICEADPDEMPTPTVRTSRPCSDPTSCGSRHLRVLSALPRGQRRARPGPSLRESLQSECPRPKSLRSGHFEWMSMKPGPAWRAETDLAKALPPSESNEEGPRDNPSHAKLFILPTVCLAGPSSRKCTLRSQVFLSAFRPHPSTSESSACEA